MLILKRLTPSLLCFLCTVYEANFLTGPADYGAVNQVITFTPQNEGDMLCVDIPIVDDNICEDDETFNVTITPNQPDCISIKPGFGEGTVTIIDDDSEWIIKIIIRNMFSLIEKDRVHSWEKNIPVFINLLHSSPLVAIVGPDQGIVHYNVTERLDEMVWIPIRLTGQKGPGRTCEVQVRTMDGTATGKKHIF